MSEKRFKKGMNLSCVDTETGKSYWYACNLCGLLNELATNCSLLQEENERLKLVISKLDEHNTGYMVENLTLNRENNHLKDDLQYYMSKSATLETELLRLRKENEQLKNDDLLFFQQVFNILMKYQHLFNREMADEVLEDLGIELTEWFE